MVANVEEDAVNQVLNDENPSQLLLLFNQRYANVFLVELTGTDKEILP